MEHIIYVDYPNGAGLIEYDPSLHLSLKDILLQNGIVLDSPCGGNGICGKCKLYIYNNTSPECGDTADRDHIEYHACRYYPGGGDISISIPQESLSKLFSGESDPDSQTYDNLSCPKKAAKNTNNDITLYAAIDLGSTTISVALIGHSETLASDTFFNPTLTYGADIISRQQAQMNGHHEDFSRILISSITSSIEKLTAEYGYNISSLKCICISGNTTMLHFLYGIDVSPLASYPFRASTLNFDSYSFKNFKTITIPSFSTYIGADIMSGLCHIYFNYSKKYNESFLFLDLGTNAEMVLKTDNEYICTSAAAGSAFEGTNISCGCAAVPGAIKKVNLHKADNSDLISITWETIGNRPPIGICGSGILSLYSRLIDNNIIDETGTLPEKYIEDGFTFYMSPERKLVITQKDIRELQLAIAAIRTGIIFLLRKSGLSINDLNHIFISGSFGKALDITTLISIGLLPGAKKSTYKRIIMTGNTSLEGAKKVVIDSDNMDGSYQRTINNIISYCNEILLAEEPDFNNVFLSELAPRQS